MIRHFILVAWRNIKRKKTLSIIQILCLSIGLASFTLITRYIQYEKDWDKFNTNYSRIYRVQSYEKSDRMKVNDQISAPISKYLRENIPEVENAITIIEVWGEYLSSDVEHTFNEPDGYLAPSDIFSMFSFELVRGDKKNVLNQPNSIVLNKTLAEKYFPGQDAMGKTILDERKNKLIVTGIMNDVPEQSEIRASYFKSNKNLLKLEGENWDNDSYRSFVLLKPKVSFMVVSDKISNILNEHANTNSPKVLYLKPLSDLHLNSSPQDNRSSVVFFFSLIGILTLFLACVSFMNLTTSFSTLRSVEIGIRKVSGSNKNYIRLQFLSEAIVLSCISFALAIIIAYLILPIFNNVVDRNIELDFFKNPMFTLYLFITVVITGFIAGSYPALIVSGFKPVTVLKGKNPLIKGKIRGLNAMVYFQFVLSIILITSSLWVYKQVDFLKNKDLGFNEENLLSCKLPELNTNISYNLLRERVLENPGVESMSISVNSPMHSMWRFFLKYEDGPAEKNFSSRWNRACSNYVNTMSMKLVEGRNFEKEYSPDNKTCLINETAVRSFGWDNPIGKWIDTGERYAVVGVIKDFVTDDVHNPVLPYILLLHEGSFGQSNNLTFKVNPTSIESCREHISSVLAELFPNILFEVTDYKTGINQNALQIWNSGKKTFVFFTVLAIIIAALGLFGLVVFASQRRIKEIGIRKVQGARAEQILPLITRQFLILVLAANAIAMPIAYLLENVTPGASKYHFTILDLLFVIGISVLIILTSSGYQAFKASRLNPVEALRYE